MILEIFWIFWIQKKINSKLLRVLLKVTGVSTEHRKWPKISKNSIKSPLFARRAKKASAGGRSPPQELEVNLRSGLYLLVICNLLMRI